MLSSRKKKATLTSVNFPLMSSLVKRLPSWSISANGPPIRGLPTPFEASRTRWRAKRAFSYEK